MINVSQHKWSWDYCTAYYMYIYQLIKDKCVSYRNSTSNKNCQMAERDREGGRTQDENIPHLVKISEEKKCILITMSSQVSTQKNKITIHDHANKDWSWLATDEVSKQPRSQANHVYFSQSHYFSESLMVVSYLSARDYLCVSRLLLNTNHTFDIWAWQVPCASTPFALLLK